MNCFRTLFRSRGIGLLTLLSFQFLYIHFKLYDDNLLHYIEGLFYVETILLILFYAFFKGLQKKSARAKLYALLPIFLYYTLYEYNLLQFGTVLKFQDFVLLFDLVSILPILEISIIVLVLITPVLLIIKNKRTHWKLSNSISTFFSGLIIVALLSPNKFSNFIYDGFFVQSFSQEHVVAAYGPLSAAFIFQHKKIIYTKKLTDYHSGYKKNTTTPTFNTLRSDNKNIHVIILESFVDTRKFQNSAFTEEYLKIFDTPILNTNSYSLAPGFGNGTARSEFEILCGVPSLQLIDPIEFNVFTGNNDIDCLPKILNDNGYITSATHPYKPNFYNRVNAYKSLSFSKVQFGDKYSKINGTIIIDDAPDGWLYDESLYNQNIQTVKELMTQKKPIFNYVLTAFGHYPFTRDIKRRPDIVSVEGISEEINRLLNQIYYRVAALDAYIQELKDTDPNSLIIIVGDHLPPLTTGKIEYDLLGYSNNNRLDSGNNLYHETLLFISDSGKILQKSNIRHFELNQIILELIFKNNQESIGLLTNKDVVDRYMNILAQGAI